MADSKKMSVEEVLAACRRMDSADKSAAPPPVQSVADDTASVAAASSEPAAAPESAPPATPAAPSSAPAAGKKPSQMSVAEMLAAARAEKAPKPAAAAPASQAPASDAPGADQPAAKPSAPAKKAGQMSVAEMLAAARAEKSGAPAAAAKPAAPKPAAEKSAAAKPASEKPAAAKAPAAKAAAKPAGGAVDTASILAAARGGSKPGPMSKAEAAAKGQAPVAKKAVTLPPLPERPAYLDEPVTPVATGTSRRSFFAAVGTAAFGSALALGFSSLFVTNLLWLLGFARFMFPNILTEPPTVFKVGFPADYAPGQVETKYVAQFGIWLVRFEYNGQPQIYAIRTVCTHLGCTPNWLEAEQKFKCPCHGSGFYKDGINFEGPAPRPLERYAIRLADDGQLEVDKSRKFQEELGQWKDAASFVPV